MAVVERIQISSQYFFEAVGKMLKQTISCSRVTAVFSV